jgi:hypothetical protein
VAVRPLKTGRCWRSPATGRTSELLRRRTTCKVVHVE